MSFWTAFHLMMAAMAWCAGFAFARDPTPLLPHPYDRPVFSQDKYKRDEPPAEPPPPENPPPVYNQDKYERPEDNPDYSDELRKVPEKGREWSEIEIAKGIIELNSTHYDAAEKHFQAALTKDPRNFVAIEYLAVIQERRGDLQGAISWLAKAKHLAPKGRWGSLNFQIGRIYLLLKNYERAEIYLRLSLDENGHLTATNYTLGYLYYLQERYFESEKYLHEAKMRASRRSALPAERDMLQAINYYLGEIYARLGFVNYAVISLRDTEYGQSWEIRNGAWRVHSEINQPALYLAVGFFAQYDSNVVLLPSGTDLPVDFSSSDSYGTVFTLNTGWHSSPAKKWSFGADLALYLNNHLNKTLAEFDIFNANPMGWVNFWNQKDWAFNARYELNHSLTDRRHFSTFQSSHGPVMSANYFPFQRWNWEFGMAYHINTFTTDPINGPDRRSGHTYTGFFKGSLRAPNPRFRPSLSYVFDGDATEGENFQSRTHSFTLEGDWRLFNKTHMVGSVMISKVSYPNNIQGRNDSLRQFRIGVNHIFNENWLGLIDITQVQDNSTVKDFTYSRVMVSSGVQYTF